MRLHVISLPHTQTTHEYLTCADTQKVIKFTKMMRAQGYEVILYAGEENEAECDEHVQLVSESERSGWFGGGRGFDTVFTPLEWDPKQVYWRTMNERAITEIGRRASQRDLLCLIGGNCQQPIAAAFPALTAVEWGVGYEGIFSNFCAFESYAWMHHVYGKTGIVNGRAYDRVIPNFFDPTDFTVGHPNADRPYLLFLGRVIQRKGPHVAAEIAMRLGVPLVVAGPGGAWNPGRQFLLTPEGVRIEGDVEYVGEVGVGQRATLLAGATALLAPTLYIEPFGGVAVEAMFSGTPVVASDWGAFTETVPRAVGRRFRTLAEGVQAVEEATTLDRAAIAEHAKQHYSLDAVGPQFRSWFDRLDTLWGEGWYT